MARQRIYRAAYVPSIILGNVKQDAGINNPSHQS
jgi:hypothetical protein